MKHCNNKSLASGVLAVSWAIAIPTFQHIYCIRSELGGRKVWSDSSSSSSNIQPKHWNCFNMQSNKTPKVAATC